MKKLIAILFAWCLTTLAFAAPIDINTADAKTIADSLPGIGLKKAEGVVKYRTEKGPFKSVDDLENVSGIGKKTVERIKQDILIGDAAAPAAPVTSVAVATPVAAPAAPVATPTPVAPAVVAAPVVKK
jgi:competence protein ComEA